MLIYYFCTPFLVPARLRQYQAIDGGKALTKEIAREVFRATVRAASEHQLQGQPGSPLSESSAFQSLRRFHIGSATAQPDGKARCTRCSSRCSNCCSALWAAGDTLLAQIRQFYAIPSIRFGGRLASHIAYCGLCATVLALKLATEEFAALTELPSFQRWEVLLTAWTIAVFIDELYSSHQRTMQEQTVQKSEVGSSESRVRVSAKYTHPAGLRGRGMPFGQRTFLESCLMLGNQLLQLAMVCVCLSSAQLGANTQLGGLTVQKLFYYGFHALISVGIIFITIGMLNFFTVFKRLGALVIIFERMLDDIGLFIVLLSIVMLSFIFCLVGLGRSGSLLDVLGSSSSLGLSPVWACAHALLDPTTSGLHPPRPPIVAQSFLDRASCLQSTVSLSSTSETICWCPE